MEFYQVHYLDTTTLVSPVERSVDRIPPIIQSASVDSGGVLPPRTTKILVKALYDFQGQDDEDLPFRKGDILEIINKQEEKENGFTFFFVFLAEIQIL